MLSSDKSLEVEDFFPLNSFQTNGLKWLQDLVSPFYLFIRMRYTSIVKQDENLLENSSLSFESSQEQILFGSKKKIFKGNTVIKNGQLDSFSIQFNHKIIEVTCSN